MVDEKENNENSIYEIKIKGHLDKKWADWLFDMTITHENDGTSTLFGLLPDQAALHSILLKLRDLNLALINIRKINGSND